MLQAYGSFGLTSVVYTVTFTDVAQFHRFCLISPKTLFALDVTVSICGDHIILLPDKGEVPLLVGFVHRMHTPTVVDLSWL